MTPDLQAVQQKCNALEEAAKSRDEKYQKLEAEFQTERELFEKLEAECQMERELQVSVLLLLSPCLTLYLLSACELCTASSPIFHT